MYGTDQAEAVGGRAAARRDLEIEVPLTQRLDDLRTRKVAFAVFAAANIGDGEEGHALDWKELAAAVPKVVGSVMAEPNATGSSNMIQPHP